METSTIDGDNFRKSLIIFGAQIYNLYYIQNTNPNQKSISMTIL